MLFLFFLVLDIIINRPDKINDTKTIFILSNGMLVILSPSLIKEAGTILSLTNPYSSIVYNEHIIKLHNVKSLLILRFLFLYRNIKIKKKIIKNIKNKCPVFILI